MISGRQSRLDALRVHLEDQFEVHTSQLTTLTRHSTDPERHGIDRETLATLVASSRQALADITGALKRMADGEYGRCERCQGDIPVERLEVRPAARFCVPCQSRPN